MGNSVIAIGAANRSEVLDRCIQAAADGCSVAQAAQWLVLDDSSGEGRAANRDVVGSWRRRGLQIAFIDPHVQAQVADSLGTAWSRTSFLHLVARPQFYRVPGGRNLGLLLGLALNPDVLFFFDDDMVHRHRDDGCFLHWCASVDSQNSFVAAPRKLGIRDMSYLNRLSTILSHDDWPRFVSALGMSADPEAWYSGQNPLWKTAEQPGDPRGPAPSTKEIVSGQLMAIRGVGQEWLPFPDEYNEDLNWSLLQRELYGTRLLRVGGVDARHLPPSIGHCGTDTIVTQIVGAAITRVLKQIKLHARESLLTYTREFQAVLGPALKHESLLLVAAEGAVRSRASNKTDMHVRELLSKIESSLMQVKRRLQNLDVAQLTTTWLGDFDARRRTFSALRGDDAVQAQIRAVVSRAMD